MTADTTRSRSPAQRRQDLLLAAELLRHQIGVDLARLEPAGDRVAQGAALGLWLRRHWPRSRIERTAVAAAALASVIGGTGISWFALRRWRWVRNALVVWRLWKQLRA